MSSPRTPLEAWFVRVARNEAHRQPVTRGWIKQKLDDYLQAVSLVPARSREEWMTPVDLLNLHTGMAIRNQYTILRGEPPAMVRACGYMLATFYRDEPAPARMDLVLLAAVQSHTNRVASYVHPLSDEEVIHLERRLTVDGNSQINRRSEYPENEVAPVETVRGRNLETGAYGELCANNYRHLEAWAQAVTRTIMTDGFIGGTSMPAILADLLPGWSPAKWSVLSNTEKLYCVTTYNIVNHCIHYRDGVHSDVEACGLLLALPHPHTPLDHDYEVAGITRSGTPGAEGASIAQLAASSWILDEAPRYMPEVLTTIIQP